MADSAIKKNILIIFTDTHLTYSPSTLNLFYKLKQHHNVELISTRNASYFTANEVTDEKIKYIDFTVKRTLWELLQVLLYKISDKFFKPSEKALKTRYLLNYKSKALIKYIKQTNGNIIAVDFFALWCVQKAGKKADILSLEIHENDVYFDAVNLSSINSVIIQSKERLDHLFPQEKPRNFIIQNAPPYSDLQFNYLQRNKKDLIYCGSAVYSFGIISCLEFLEDYPDYTLTIQGALPNDVENFIHKNYSQLLTEGRLILSAKYLSAKELTRFVSKYRIGFAFYDFYRYPHLRTFNYATAPSGKVFQYLNSGLPVIANSIPGFKFIETANCGKLINSLGSLQIKNAIDAIESDYINLAQKAKALSAEFDFDKMVMPFLQYVEKEYNAS